MKGHVLFCLTLYIVMSVFDSKTAENTGNTRKKTGNSRRPAPTILGAPGNIGIYRVAIAYPFPNGYKITIQHLTCS